MQNNHFVGDTYEKAAVFYLKNIGYQILKTNFKCKAGEIDIIAREGEYLVFVEVKFRKDLRKGSPQEAVNLYKQRKICKVAKYYIYRQGLPLDTPCRFDVVAVLNKEVKLFRNAFDYVE